MTTREQLVADVKAAIRDSGTRQVWVAERLGISAKHLSQMLGGKAVMNIDWAEQILRLCGMRLALTVEGALPEPLRSSIECVLLDHHKELDGEDVDANLAELAFVYGQLTGFNAIEEVRQDRAKLDAESTFPVVHRTIAEALDLNPDGSGFGDPTDEQAVALESLRQSLTQAALRRTEQDGGIPNDALTRTDWDAAYGHKPKEAP